jgi:hypothetical protein
MADIRYVQSGYVDDSYVVVQHDAGNISINTAIANDRSWDDMGTWDNPIQGNWQQFSADPLVVVGAPVGDIITATTTSSTATAIANITELNISADATFTVSAEAQREGEIITAFATTVVSDADVIRTGASDITSTTTTQADAITGFSETVDITVSTTVADTDPLFITKPTSDIVVSSSVTALGGKVNPGTVNIVETITTTAATGESGLLVDPITITTNTTVVSDADRIADGGSAITTTTTVADVDTQQFIGASADISAFTTTVSIAAGFAIDPFRTKLVASETRINILQQETRSRLVPSETRTFKVTPGSNTQIVDLAGLIDRREG